jgi:acyl-CoA thioester hydrolase
MWNKDKTQLKSLLWSTFVHFNLATQKSEMHNQALLDFFKPFENPLPQSISFEERVQQLKNKA